MTALSKRRDWRIPGALWERIRPGRFARALTGMRLLRVSCVLVWRGICDGLRPKPRVTCCQEIAHRFLRWRGVMSMAAATSAALWRQALEDVYRKDAPMTQKHAL